MENIIVLTKYWAFWGERPLKDAIRLIVKGKVEVIKADDGKDIKTGISRDGATFKMSAPLIIRLLEFGGIKVKSEKVKYSKEAVFERDNYCCQYYHYDDDGKRYIHRCSKEEISLDHVIPKCQGGEDKSFRNTVACCKWHNINVKKGRTPKEAQLKLVQKPTTPKRNKGDMVILRFQFNPESSAHRAFQEIMGGG